MPQVNHRIGPVWNRRSPFTRVASDISGVNSRDSSSELFGGNHFLLRISTHSALTCVRGLPSAYLTMRE